MRVLILGSGGREHALAWRLARDPEVTDLISAPGNPGMAAVGRTAGLSINDAIAVKSFVEAENVDLTVVGPEAPLEAGVAEALRDAGHPVIGPGRAGAQLECSKVFAKRFMAVHGIPTARFAVHTELKAALAAVSGDEFGFPVVVKADGLAAGKGVVVAATRAEAEAAVRACLEARAFGDAGASVVIEECLTGPEVSYFVLCDGTRAVRLGSAQDHKRAYDDDRGPNTGGMGAFAPSPLMNSELERIVMRDIVQIVMDAIPAYGRDLPPGPEGELRRDEYRGFLYVSLMLTPIGPRVIEFNVRFGDPEAQVILPSIEGEFAASLMAAARGEVFRAPRLFESPDKFVGVVMASGGYPGRIETGRQIHGLDAAGREPGVLVFHAGTKEDDGRIVTSGGRVLTVVGRGATYRDAIERAYAGVGRIAFDGVEYRRDIGRRAVTPF